MTLMPTAGTVPSAADVSWQPQTTCSASHGSSTAPYTRHLAAPVMGTARPGVYSQKHEEERDNNSYPQPPSHVTTSVRASVRAGRWMRTGRDSQQVINHGVVERRGKGDMAGDLLSAANLQESERTFERCF